MKIAVCIAHVPDTATKVRIGADGRSIDPTGVTYVLNPYDEFAVEEALLTKEKAGGEVVALCIGGPETEPTIRKVLAMGADRAVRIDGEPEDTLVAARWLADVLREEAPDIVFVGKETVSFNGAAMAAALGELLGWPNASVVVRFTLNRSVATYEREVEGGKELGQITLPCVISCQRGLNNPRLPKLPDIMKAKQKPIAVRQPVGGRATMRVVRLELPPPKKGCKFVKSAEELVRLLHEEAGVI
ncbi:MAG: electron transfer flavoprotein subunit beta/FixA family protein [Bacteroidota bacterium]|nr:electron transfer flavoprotein subunit beta/FixA family protein [Rhodothermia bacterium]MDW8284691.1 electron transfer flavoprotein subunit beta/FixA family protein [Bacteroidota bacterium]